MNVFLIFPFQIKSCYRYTIRVQNYRVGKICFNWQIVFSWIVEISVKFLERCTELSAYRQSLYITFGTFYPYSTHFVRVKKIKFNTFFYSRIVILTIQLWNITHLLLLKELIKSWIFDLQFSQLSLGCLSARNY